MLKLSGKNADLIHARLSRWSLEDANGLDGDSLTLVINSDEIDGLPPKGEKYRAYLGDVERGEFQISSRSFSLQPRTITLVLTVAPFSVNDKTEFRARKSFSWSDATISKIVSDCVTPHGFIPVVHPLLKNIVIKHIDRTDETLQAFLRRMAKQFDAVAKPVDDKFIFAPKGMSKAASGKAIETVTLSLPAYNSPLSSDFVNVTGDLDGRFEFNGVRAFWISKETGIRQEVQRGEDPFKPLRQDKNSKEEAEQACAAELRKIKREGRKLTITAPINPKIFAEGLIHFDASFPKLIEGMCSIDKVSFSGQGQQASGMSISATLIVE